MGHAYRSHYDQIVGRRIAEVRLGRMHLLPVLPELRAVRSARIARAAAGAVGIAGMGTVVVLACMNSGGMTTCALLGSSIAAVVVYGLARVVLRLVPALTLPSELPRLTGDLTTDLAKLEE